MLIRDMVCQALSNVGGVKYLEQQAIAYPGPFLALIGKTMPIQVGGDPSNPLTIAWPVPPSRVER